MKFRQWINKIVRIVLLSAVAFGVLLYVFGIVANAFGLMEMRRSNEKLKQIFSAASPHEVIIDYVDHPAGLTSYAAMKGISPEPVAVFFVHGSPGSMDAYTDFLLDPRLQQSADLYTYDRLGYGMTTPSEKGEALIPQSEQLFSLVRQMNAPKNIYVGHSLGCSIIGRLAIDHPEVVQGLIMISAPLDPELEPSSWWRPLLDFPMIRIAIPHAMRISNEELAPLKKDLEACLPLWDRVYCPVTFIHGDRDGLVPVENVAFGKQVLTNSANVREVILEGKGHLILWSQEEVIVEEILKMIDK